MRPFAECGASLLGIVSEGDILVKEGGPRDEQRGFLRRLPDAARSAQKARALKVRDAMTTQVVDDLAAHLGR